MKMKIDRSAAVSEAPKDDLSVAVEMIKEASKSTDSTPVEFLNSSCAVLNCAASGKAKNGGWARGRIINLVGDGSSGKTLLSLELAAFVFYKMMGNRSINFPPVKKIRIVYDNTEGVMDFPIDKMYGKAFVDAVEWISSATVQAWGRNVAREVLANKPGELLLYITDSLDALTSQEGLERFEKAAEKDKEEDGTYGTEKAAYLSKSFFSNMCSMITGKDVTIVIISQIRMKIGVTFGEKYNRAGGKSLDFYTHQVCWLAEVEKLKKTFRGEERVYGIRVLAKMKRSKVSKPFREAEFIVLFDYGVDDIGSSLAYLYRPKVPQLDWDGIKYSRADLIKHIEDHNLQDELSARVERWWNEIEDNMRPNRISKY